MVGLREWKWSVWTPALQVHIISSHNLTDDLQWEGISLVNFDLGLVVYIDEWLNHQGEMGLLGGQGFGTTFFFHVPLYLSHTIRNILPSCLTCSHLEWKRIHSLLHSTDYEYDCRWQPFFTFRVSYLIVLTKKLPITRCELYWVPFLCYTLDGCSNDNLNHKIMRRVVEASPEQLDCGVTPAVEVLQSHARAGHNSTAFSSISCCWLVIRMVSYCSWLCKRKGSQSQLAFSRINRRRNWMLLLEKLIDVPST